MLFETKPKKYNNGLARATRNIMVTPPNNNHVINLAIQWLAWTDSGEGVYRADQPATYRVSEHMKCWQLNERCIPDDAPRHYSALWSVRGGRFFHDPSKTLKMYDVKDGDTILVLFRCRNVQALAQ